jgi:hypothetical protein
LLPFWAIHSEVHGSFAGVAIEQQGQLGSGRMRLLCAVAGLRLSSSGEGVLQSHTPGTMARTRRFANPRKAAFAFGDLARDGGDDAAQQRQDYALTHYTKNII